MLIGCSASRNSTHATAHATPISVLPAAEATAQRPMRAFGGSARKKTTICVMRSAHTAASAHSQPRSCGREATSQRT